MQRRKWLLPPARDRKPSHSPHFDSFAGIVHIPMPNQWYGDQVFIEFFLFHSFQRPSGVRSIFCRSRSALHLTLTIAHKFSNYKLARASVVELWALSVLGSRDFFTGYQFSLTPVATLVEYTQFLFGYAFDYKIRQQQQQHTFHACFDFRQQHIAGARACAIHSGVVDIFILNLIIV